jgi:uncharacterized protein (DUF362 family)
LKPIVYISHRDFIPESPQNFSPASINIISEMLAEALAPFALGKLVKDQKVLIKPNLVRPDYISHPAICTDPRVIIALGRLVRDAGAGEVAVGDNPGVGLSFREAVKNIPAFENWGKHGIEPFFFDNADTVEIELGQSALFRKMKMPRKLLDFTVLINLPKLKMHMHTGTSLGIKNLYGLLSDEQRMTFHRQDVNRKLVEILQAFNPGLTVVDGIWALEGQAPICGTAVEDFNTILAGENPVAMDAVAAEAMGIHPDELATIRLANAKGLGPKDLRDIEIRGTPLEIVRRHLKRPVVSSVGVFSNCEVLELGACVGCMSSMRHALDRMQFSGELKRLPVNTYILGIPGPDFKLLPNWKGELWLIGDCSLDLSVSAGNSIQIPGCPPHFLQIIQTLRENYIEKKFSI